MTTTERTFSSIGAEVSLIAAGTMTDQPGTTDVTVGLHDDARSVWIEIPLDLGIAGDTVSISVPLDALRHILPPVLPFMPGEYVMHPAHTAPIREGRANQVLRVVEVDDTTAIVATADGEVRIPVAELIRPRSMDAPR